MLITIVNNNNNNINMQIFVRLMDGKTISFCVEPIDTIDKLKIALEEKTKIAPKDQRLVCNCKHIDEGSFADNEIGMNSTIHLVPILRGD